MTANIWVIAAYLSFVGLAVVFAAFGALRPSKLAPLGELLTFIMHHRITRIALFMVWWWLGWHFLVGTTVR